MAQAERDVVVIDGIEYQRSIQHRCINIGKHARFVMTPANCPCHRQIPMPCPDCYAIEVLSRQIPWSALGWPEQGDAEGARAAMSTNADGRSTTREGDDDDAV